MRHIGVNVSRVEDWAFPASSQISLLNFDMKHQTDIDTVYLHQTYPVSKTVLSYHLVREKWDRTRSKSSAVSTPAAGAS